MRSKLATRYLVHPYGQENNGVSRMMADLVIPELFDGKQCDRRTG